MRSESKVEHEFMLPTTGACSIQTEPDMQDIQTTLNRVRAQLRDTLKTMKRTKEKDYVPLLKVLEDYLPLLSRLTLSFTHLASDSPLTSWRSVFMDNKIPGKAFPRIDHIGMPAEAIFVFLTHALALSNFANTQQGQAKQQALCRAAGAHQFILDVLVSAVEQSNAVIPELDPALHRSLLEFALGRAQLQCLAILEAKTSNTILCRVGVGAADHFSASVGLLSAHSMYKSLPTELPQALVRYQKRALAKAYLYLGKERAKLGEIGFAIACAQYSITLDSSDELSATLLREWAAENNKVAFQPVAKQSDVLAQLPSGREFVKATPFVYDGTIGADLAPSNRQDYY